MLLFLLFVCTIADMNEATRILTAIEQGNDSHNNWYIKRGQASISSHDTLLTVGFSTITQVTCRFVVITCKKLITTGFA